MLKQVSNLNSTSKTNNTPILARRYIRFLILLFIGIYSGSAYAETWLPWTTRVCAGENYTQITSSGRTRPQVGIKTQYCRCTLGFAPKRQDICAGKLFTASCKNSAWSHYEQVDFGTSRGKVWSPKRSTVYVGTSFTQTSECGFTRTSTGTKPLPDSDNDGVPNNADSCPGTPAGQSINSQGCSLSQLDSDNDGASDAVDQCPNTTGGSANSVGCAPYQLDTDNDGINDAIDQCPNTSGTPNSVGCAPYQLDTDNDGVSDAVDQCPNTTATANADGCSPSQLDTDNDGVNDAIDQCPATPPSTEVDNLGCALPDNDLDGDGILNDQDAYPLQSATQCLA